MKFYRRCTVEHWGSFQDIAGGPTYLASISECQCALFKLNRSCRHTRHVFSEACLWDEGLSESIPPDPANPERCPVCGGPTSVYRA